MERATLRVARLMFVWIVIGRPEKPYFLSSGGAGLT